MSRGPRWVRVVVSLGAGLGFAVLVAVALAVVELYLSGHGRTPLSAPLIDWPPLGVHLSWADVVLLGAAVIGVVLTWRSTGNPGA